jgi:sulfite exporter TauE/SafE
MEFTLALSAFLLGIAGIPHCAAMCGASCTAVLGACSRGGGGAAASAAPWGFHLARVAGYAAAGGVAAAGVATLAWAGAAWPVLRPAWTLLHAAALALGLWMAWAGRQPAWMTLVGHRRFAAATAAASAAPDMAGGGWQRLAGPVPAAAAGLAWVAWPCGLLQSALVVAGLANSPWGGALVMASFGLASAAGLQFVPWWLQRRWRLDAWSPAMSAWSARAAGLLLALGSAWALGRDLWQPMLDACFG